MGLVWSEAADARWAPDPCSTGFSARLPTGDTGLGLRVLEP